MPNIQFNLIIIVAYVLFAIIAGALAAFTGVGSPFSFNISIGVLALCVTAHIGYVIWQLLNIFQDGIGIIEEKTEVLDEDIRSVRSVLQQLADVLESIFHSMDRIQEEQKATGENIQTILRSLESHNFTLGVIAQNKTMPAPSSPSEESTLSPSCAITEDRHPVAAPRTPSYAPSMVLDEVDDFDPFEDEFQVAPRPQTPAPVSAPTPRKSAPAPEGSADFPFPSALKSSAPPPAAPSPLKKTLETSNPPPPPMPAPVAPASFPEEFEDDDEFLAPPPISQTASRGAPSSAPSFLEEDEDEDDLSFSDPALERRRSSYGTDQEPYNGFDRRSHLHKDPAEETFSAPSFPEVSPEEEVYQSVSSPTPSSEDTYTYSSAPIEEMYDDGEEFYQPHPPVTAPQAPTAPARDTWDDQKSAYPTPPQEMEEMYEDEEEQFSAPPPPPPVAPASPAPAPRSAAPHEPLDSDEGDEEFETFSPYTAQGEGRSGDRRRNSAPLDPSEIKEEILQSFPELRTETPSEEKEGALFPYPFNAPQPAAPFPDTRRRRSDPASLRKEEIKEEPQQTGAGSNRVRPIKSSASLSPKRGLDTPSDTEGEPEKVSSPAATPSPFARTPIAEQILAQRTDRPLIQPPKLKFDVVEVLHYAIQTNAIDLFVQPILDFETRETRFYEGFSRIRDPNDNYIMPDVYMKHAIESNLIAGIDNLMVVRSLQMVRAMTEKNKGYGMFVNISNHSLEDQTFMEQFIEIMKERSYFAQKLIFEINQSAFKAMSAESWEIIAEGMRLGFGLSLDNIEDWLLNLDMLAARGIRYMKVRQPVLMAGIADKGVKIRPHDLRPMLNDHGIMLIVEKVETEESYEQLYSIGGCDFVQGYLFGQPFSADKLVL